MKELNIQEIDEQPYHTEYPNVLCHNCNRKLKHHTMINKRVIDASRWPKFDEPAYFYYKIIGVPKCPERPLQRTTANKRH